VEICAAASRDLWQVPDFSDDWGGVAAFFHFPEPWTGVV
jgi:hypothetical protein